MLLNKTIYSKNAIFPKLKPSQNIILLQETHSSKEIENKWKKLMGWTNPFFNTGPVRQ